MIKVVFETITNKIKNVVDSVGNLFTGGSSKSNYNVSPYAADIPEYEPADLGWYAKGGLFNKASVIGVGEAGEEAVLPLTNSRAMNMIADSISANASFSGLNENMLTNAVARGVAMAMMMNSSNNKKTEYMQNNIYFDGDVMARVLSKAMADRDYRYNPTPRYEY